MVIKKEVRVFRKREIQYEDRFYCEICGQPKKEEIKAIECEAQGEPDFSYNVGDIIEIMFNGKKRKITIRGRYPVGHHAIYLQGDFSRIPERVIKEGFLGYLYKNPDSVEDRVVDEEGSSRAKVEALVYNLRI